MNDGPSLKQVLHSGTRQIATLQTLNSPEFCELLSQLGVDWILIDAEHSPLDPAAAQRLLIAIRPPCFSVIRVPDSNFTTIKRFIDLGPDGILIPQVESAAQVEAVVAAARYPPLGKRSVGIGRAHTYGLKFSDYISKANSALAVMIQIESVTAVENLETILGVSGIDGVLIGPYDLSGSMGHLGQVDHPSVVAAIATIREACIDRRIPVGMFVATADAALKQIEGGCQFLVVGVDTSLMAREFSSIFGKVRLLFKQAEGK